MSDYEMGEPGATRVSEYFNQTIGQHMPRKDQRASFATYAFGLLGEGDRKSVEPIAARACGDDEECDRVHDRLLYFVREGAWSDRHVRREACRYVVRAMEKREPVTCWIGTRSCLLTGTRPGVHSSLRPARSLKQKAIELEVRHVVGVNESNAHFAAGLAGVGVIQTLSFLAQPAVDRGELVPVLTRFQPKPYPLHLAYPPNRHVSNRLRVFIDWAVEAFARSVA
jgi:DNA-binding transcriptional LysR family regulator